MSTVVGSTPGSGRPGSGPQESEPAGSGLRGPGLPGSDRPGSGPPGSDRPDPGPPGSDRPDPALPGSDRQGSGLRILRVEVVEGLLAILREPAALFFSVLMPVGFFALFASMFGNQPATPGGLPVAATMLATFGTFGVVSVMLLNPGIGVAEDRTRGWLRVKKVSAAPIGTTILGKVLAALPYALALLLAITAVSLAVAGPVLDVGTWLRLMAVLLLGSLPFALLGLAVGFVASSNAAAAILNAVLFPMVIVSGLWFPLEFLPAFLQTIAPFLPTYHLAQLALAQLTGAGTMVHVVALLITTAVAGGLAAWAYRNLRL